MAVVMVVVVGGPCWPLSMGWVVCHRWWLLQEAVNEGSIYWHAFPFNAELEVMSPDLVQFGVQMTHHLDHQFGALRSVVVSRACMCSQLLACARQVKARRSLSANGMCLA